MANGEEIIRHLLVDEFWLSTHLEDLERRASKVGETSSSNGRVSLSPTEHSVKAPRSGSSACRVALARLRDKEVLSRKRAKGANLSRAVCTKEIYTGLGQSASCRR